MRDKTYLAKYAEWAFGHWNATVVEERVVNALWERRHFLFEAGEVGSFVRLGMLPLLLDAVET